MPSPFATTLDKIRGFSPRALRLFLPLALLLLMPLTAHAEEEVAMDGANTLFVLMAGFMVFIMNAGFAFLEAGLCRSKNVVNILAKNFAVFALACLAYWAVGYGFMFGSGNSIVGLSDFMLSDDSIHSLGIPVYAFFFFQLAFAAAGCSIISGAVAERIKYGSYLLFGFIYVPCIYAISGHWVWGGGWLSALSTPFHDFAGSTVVHSSGGWAALAGILVLGPRIGKFKADGSVQPIPPHSFPLVVLGTFLLWFGWYGFNPGSELAIDVTAARVVVTTSLAAVSGIFGAHLVSWMKFGKPDLSMIANGCLAGLVAITAPCAVVTPAASVVIGFIAGVIVVFSVLFFDKIKIDDPVGALSVHLVNGIWGTLSIGLFAHPDYILSGMSAGLLKGGGISQLIAQIIGVVSIGAFTFIVALIVWNIVKVVMGGIRVSAEEEHTGLDLGEMGIEGYGGDPVALHHK